MAFVLGPFTQQRFTPTAIRPYSIMSNKKTIKEIIDDAIEPLTVSFARMAALRTLAETLEGVAADFAEQHGLPNPVQQQPAGQCDGTCDLRQLVDELAGGQDELSPSQISNVLAFELAKNMSNPECLH